MSEPTWQEHKENATGFTEVPVREETLSLPALFYKMYEVASRRPDDWWSEFVYQEPGYRWTRFRDKHSFFDALQNSDGIRHHPPKVKLSGEVEPEVIEMAYEVQGWADSKEANKVAKALLDCVKRED